MSAYILRKLFKGLYVSAHSVDIFVHVPTYRLRNLYIKSRDEGYAVGKQFITCSKTKTDDLMCQTYKKIC